MIPVYEDFFWEKAFIWAQKGGGFKIKFQRFFYPEIDVNLCMVHSPTRIARADPNI